MSQPQSVSKKVEDDTPKQPAVHAEFPHRLPPIAVPSHYELHLTPNLTTFKYQATIHISLNLLKPSKTISLNAAELTIKSATLTRSTDKDAKAPVQLTATFQEDDEICILTASEELSAGEGVLSIEFEGEHNDKMRGCYRSKYHTPEGDERWMIVTQFESTDARRAMPCWDEPAYKASFTLHLTTAKQLTAVSNMPITDTQPAKEGGDLVTHTFDKSPIMSSYLYAWVVGEFDFIEDKTPDGTVVRVYTPVGKKEQGRFALQCALRVLPFYNDFFKHKYPLPKLDMLAIADFAAGAMENWGCVTYRMSAILIDAVNSSAATKQNVALTVTHEISHQWFGNLVTMDWWEGLWLNEGFATWMENFATAWLFPDWRMWDQFVYNDVNEALQLDALLSSHPIEVPIEHSDDVDEIFDAISYSKGSVVVRLLQGFLGIDEFQKGIQSYITQYEYGNANTADLWSQLEKTSGKPVKEMMEGWTKQVGFPLITISEGRQDGDAIVYDVEQRRLLTNGVKKDDETLWFVPINFLTSHTKQPEKEPAKDSAKRQLLKERKAQLRLESSQPLSALKWVKINAAQTGFYRVLYPASARAAFRDAIAADHSVMSPADRLGLAGDLFACARAGLLATAEVLEFVQVYEAEEEYVVWADVLSNLDDLADILKHTDMYDAFNAYVRTLIGRIVAKVGWEKQQGDDHCSALLRAAVLNAGVDYDEPSVAKEAERRFGLYYTAVKAKNDKDAAAILPADFRSAVYRSVVEHGGTAAYEKLLELGKLTDLHEEKMRCLRALSAAEAPELTDRSLQYAMSGSVRSQDAPSFVSALAGNRKASHRVWQYVQQHWQDILKRYGGTTSLSRIVGIVDNFSDHKTADEAERFFKDNKTPGANQAVKQSLEALRSNADYLQREGDNIRAFLNKQQQQQQHQQQQQ